MLAYTESRLRKEESGFTLIELLVVMIIISILMAVAVPAYLGQKQKAVASQAKQNIDSIVKTIDSCSAGTTNGLYKEGTLECRIATTIQTEEPSLATLMAAATSLPGTCPAPAAGNAGTYVTCGNSQGDNYAVAASVRVGGSTDVEFVMIKDSAGSVTKWCGVPTTITPSSSATAVQTTPFSGTLDSAGRKVCGTGTW